MEVLKWTDPVNKENHSLKEKIENLKLVIKQCNQQLATEKIKNNGVETVAKLLQETRDELQTTVKQKRALEAAVRNLQNRLAANRLPEDISIRENDVYMPSLSPQTLENLARENVRLKNLLHQCATTEEIQDFNKAQYVIDDLNKQLSNLTVENETLASEVYKLRCSVTDGKQGSNGTNQCLDDIQSVLRNFASQCQDLDEKLNTVKSQNPEKVGSNENVIIKGNGQHNNSVHRELNELQEQNAQLEAKIQEVTFINVKWQDYTKQQDRALQDCKAQLLEYQSNAPNSAEVNDALKIAHDKLIRCEEEKTKLSEKVYVYKSQYDEQQLAIAEKEACIKSLKEDLNSARSTLTHNDNETISVLMTQIQIIAEDFETERKDRARAQADLAEVKTQSDKYKGQSLEYKTQLEQSKSETEQYKVLYLAKCNPPVQRNFSHHGYGNLGSQESQLTSRGHREAEELVMDGGPGSLNMKEYEIVDPMAKDHFQSLPMPTKKGSKKKSKDILGCPKCSKVFDKDEQLFSHVQNCVL